MDSLTLMSSPGVYEIATDGGPTYELTVPVELDEAGVLIIDRTPGEPDELTPGDKFLRVFEAFFKVGEEGVILREKDGDESVNAARTKTVISITQVA